MSSINLNAMLTSFLDVVLASNALCWVISLCRQAINHIFLFTKRKNIPSSICILFCLGQCVIYATRGYKRDKDYLVSSFTKDLEVKIENYIYIIIYYIYYLLICAFLYIEQAFIIKNKFVSQNYIWLSFICNYWTFQHHI